MQARRGELVDVLEGDGLVAVWDGPPVGAVADRVGLLTWRLEATEASAEIRAVAVAADARGQGIGRALLEGAHEALAASGARSAWLVTTNDNEPALRLYASLGYALVEVRHGAIDEIRRTMKPTIPLVGHGGIEMHDELELRRSIWSRG